MAGRAGRTVALDEHDRGQQGRDDPDLAEDLVAEVGDASRRSTRGRAVSIPSSLPPDAQQRGDAPGPAVRPPRVPLGVIAGVAWIRRI